MRRFFFDLLMDNVVVLDPGGMIYEHVDTTITVADGMVRHLLLRKDLQDRDVWVRVRDARGREVYRAAVAAEAAEPAG